MEVDFIHLISAKNERMNLMKFIIVISVKDEDHAERICPTHNIKLQRRRGYRGPFYECPKYFSAEKCKYTEDA